mgnify:CR=1 FL=1
MSLRSGIITIVFLLVAAMSAFPSPAGNDGHFIPVDHDAGITLTGVIAEDTGNGRPSGSISENSAEQRLRELTDSLAAIVEGRISGTDPERMVAEIERIISSDPIADTLLLSDALYFSGIHCYQTNNYSRANNFFSLSVRYREDISLADRRYALGISNMAASLFRTGDYQGAYIQGIKGLVIRRMVSVTDSSGLVGNYLNLSSSCLEMNDNEKAVELAEAGLLISRIYPDDVQPKVKADLYQVIGLSLYRTQEYNKSLFYCREALRIYELYPEVSVESRILLYNTIGQVYRRLGKAKEAEEHFSRGLSVRDSRNTRDKYLLYINYSTFLVQEGRLKEAERVLEQGLDEVGTIYGPESREYSMMLVSVAEFVDSSLGDRDRSIELYERSFSYIRLNQWDIAMANFLAAKYSRALLGAGRYREVLEVTADADSLSNHVFIAWNDQTEVKPDHSGEPGISEDMLNLLETRYAALNALADIEGSREYLDGAIVTGRKLAAMYDRQRLEMSEDESRTSLSSYSRDIYTGLVGNYADLRKDKHDRESLEGLYEFAERSKVAGFLASMRELNATRFSLPDELSGLDAEIRRKAGFYREMIAREQMGTHPDSIKLATWESAVFRLLRQRDSLVRIFERDYPAYYNLKFTNKVTPMSETGKVLGRRTNLLSYVLTDEKLYIFVASGRKKDVIVRDIDSTFFDDLHRFRDMLSTLPEATGSRAPFNEFMDLAYSLYRVLIEPAEPLLSGDRIVISPDNILSYLPFETLVTEEFRSPGLRYRDAPFALKKYRFSYIYSVTLSSEVKKRSRRLNNRLIAFAPTYEGVELDDTLIAGWPSLRGEIRELPFALLEAEDAVSQCGGMAFLGEEAREETFKSEAQDYDIIHLAMHTLVDDRRPAFSKMLFTAGPGGSNDGMLNTYEVYSIPLNAMMVVLSSCNTGTGMLVTGEGILSLARGFLYAGSRSAVMSMWEVEDIAASKVIQSFYENMRGGQSKSTALRNARLKFLRDASQKKSHPYYWAAMVIYGDDTPLWFNRVNLYVALLLLLLVTMALVAVVYRGPRS